MQYVVNAGGILFWSVKYLKVDYFCNLHCADIVLFRAL